MATEALCVCARQAAVSFRLGLEAAAGEALTLLVDGLVAGLEQDPSLAEPIGVLVAELFGAQARRDPIGAADVLEFELAPLLEAQRR